MFVSSLFNPTETRPSVMVQAYGFVRTDICGLPPSDRCAEVRAALRDNRYQVRAIIRTASSRGFAQLLAALDTTPAVAVAVPDLEHLDPDQFRDLVGVADLLDVATGRWWVSTSPANAGDGLRNREMAS
ncbi:hypothetical protein [Nocardia salmonicida]|uniref:hypothetical protein n=1 Tax=Nocardia salmonicida TaxID=53431 RepID=UPI0033CC6F89